jgi:hypothetical protein
MDFIIWDNNWGGGGGGGGGGKEIRQSMKPGGGRNLVIWIWGGEKG